MLNRFTAWVLPERRYLIRSNRFPKQLGKKYKALFPKVSQAIQNIEAEEIALALLAGKTVQVPVEGIHLDIAPDEVEVRAEARSGLVVASEGPYLAALLTELTPELIDEGLAREFVRRVQDLRKQANFDIADRIHLYLQASPRLAQAIAAHRGYIMAETLALSLTETSDPPEGTLQEVELDGERVALTIVKN
jgi:isoleucyl-tRNA synthetase